MATLVSKNPATGETLAELETTDLLQLPILFARAREAQSNWSKLSVRRRAAHLTQLRETLINHLDDLVDLISKENGKPRFEALSGELLNSVDMLTYYAKQSGKILSDRQLPLSWLIGHRKSYLNYWPVGVALVISPWNFPFWLPFAELAMATVAGNAVIFKPSEVTPLIGLKIQQLFDEAGFPPHLVQTVIGDGSLGAALVQQKPNKIFFTGSVPTGKKIMAAAAEHLIPVNLELGGKNPLIVLPDADLDFATSAALWGGYSNSGQVCGSASRFIVHESVASNFTNLLKEKISKLRQGPSDGYDNDLGAITLDKQKSVYERHIKDAQEKGAKILAGGELSENRAFHQPTLVGGHQVEAADIWKEETFGPIASMTTFRTPTEAIQKANETRYGLSASVITRDLSFGETIAKQLEAGTVMINEVIYTAGIAQTPWGGVKESGIGRTHSDIGLHEFVNTRHIHKPKSRLTVFKSLWWFPYSPYQYATFRNIFSLYRKHMTDKIRAFPLVLWNLVQFIKKEKRL